MNVMYDYRHVLYFIATMLTLLVILALVRTVWLVGR